MIAQVLTETIKRDVTGRLALVENLVHSGLEANLAVTVVKQSAQEAGFIDGLQHRFTIIRLGAHHPDRVRFGQCGL